MCKPHNLPDEENGTKNNIIWICINSNHFPFKGRRDSGIQSQIPAQKKALYMDEAISKTSKWHGMFFNNLIFIKWFTFFRIWSFQLCYYWSLWCNFACCFNGSMCYCICSARFRVWFELKFKPERSFGWHRILWYTLFITFMGLLGWY